LEKKIGEKIGEQIGEKNENQGKPETIGNKYKEYYKTVKNENHAKKKFLILMLDQFRLQ